MDALARQAWVPSECSASTPAELGRGCWRRACAWRLRPGATLFGRRGGGRRAAAPLGGGFAGSPAPPQYEAGGSVFDLYGAAHALMVGSMVAGVAAVLWLIFRACHN